MLNIFEYYEEVVNVIVMHTTFSEPTLFPGIATDFHHATSDYGSALWYWEFPQLKYWLNLLDFGIEKNFSFIIVD